MSKGWANVKFKLPNVLELLKVTVEQLNDLTHYDPLTKLPNRTSFLKDIEKVVYGTKNRLY